MQVQKPKIEQIKTTITQPKIQRPQPPKTPTVIIPVKPLEVSSVEKVKSLAKSITGDFTVFVRKGGKDVKYVTAKTKEEAVKSLTRKLKGTISASGFVESGGKKLSIGDLGIVNGEFRQSKVDPFRVVQKKGKRLSSKSETSSIQLLRGGGGLLSSSKGRRKKSGFKFF